MANYYSNRWFAGTPVLTQIDQQVLLYATGVTNDYILPDLTNDYVSIKWEGYLKPVYTEDYTFVVRANDGVRITIGETVIFDELDQVVDDATAVIRTSDPVSLVADSFIPIKVEYYQITGKAFIVLEWSSTSQTSETIPASQFYTPLPETVMITGAITSASSYYTPMKVTGVIQSDSSTYASDSITIEWTTPSDNGCQAITGYKIDVDDGSSVTTTSVGVVNIDTLSSLTPGQTYSIVVRAVNSIGNGLDSDSIDLIPSTLPSASSLIQVLTYTKNALTLQWSIPGDTGAGDSTTIPIASYKLEANAGFGDGFVTLIEQSSDTYTHSGLIAGYLMTYRVTAANFLGYGTTSAEFTFSAAQVPSKPDNPPRNIPTSTTQNVIYLEYDEVTEDGGSSITSYNIYVDDGNDGAFTGPVGNALLLTYDTSALTLTSGLIYRFKYSASNVHGEGELSDEVLIQLAEISGPPSTLVRIDQTTLSAGTIRVKWTSPSDDGSDTIDGFYVYLDGDLVYDASNTEYSYTFYDLIVSQTYDIAVSAYNSIGESATTSISEIAASVPAKMSRPTWKSSTTTTIEVEWTEPSFDGGEAVTGYEVRRDAGPLTDFQTEIAESSTSYEFTGLSNTILTYRIQVRAINSIGNGEWSEAKDFYATAVPDAPSNFIIAYQSTSQITLSWGAPISDGGCDVSGYKLWMEDTTISGYNLIYDGSKNSAMLTYSVISPVLKAGRIYNFQVEAIA